MDITVTHKAKINGPVVGVNFVDGKAVNPHPAALAFFQSNDDFTVSGPKVKLGKADQGDATA